MRSLMTGNEAIARGAWEAGASFASAYPGTPSTEILENIATYADIRSQWSANEKTAFEAAWGASLGGVRSLCAMKHVGLNVAADAVFSAAYAGVNGGLVLITADDPGCHSSQNEQDNRHYARAAKIPLVEPSDSQEALDFIKTAFDISEEFDTPVLFRTTTRLSHGKSPVTTGNRVEHAQKEWARNPSKYVLIPANARTRRAALEERLHRLGEYVESSPLNVMELGAGPHSRDLGIISSGVAYHYAREVFGDGASYLKLGMSFPFPENLVRGFASQVKRVVVIEELDPFIEDAVRALGIPAVGKSAIPGIGELDAGTVAKSLGITPDWMRPATPEQVPARPPMFCAGCPHRAVFHELGKLPVAIFGDIGCYSLGVLPPFSAMDTLLDMGASVSGAVGFQQALEMSGRDTPRRTVSVIGDSTFFHSGMTGLLDSVYNNADLVTLILDNRITAMTGHQENPGTGFTLSGEPTREASIEGVVRALGIDNVKTVDSFDLIAVRQALRDAIDVPEPSVIVFRGPCALLKRLAIRKPAYHVNQETCRKCKLCLKVACPALYFDNMVQIDSSCVGCGVCSQACPWGAITVEAGE